MALRILMCVPEAASVGGLFHFNPATVAIGKHAPGNERNILEAEQLALKIIANSTSYGIFIELNVENPLKRADLKRCMS
jgi:hypothetical protein